MGISDKGTPTPGSSEASSGGAPTADFLGANSRADGHGTFNL